MCWKEDPPAPVQPTSGRWYYDQSYDHRAATGSDPPERMLRPYPCHPVKELRPMPRLRPIAAAAALTLGLAAVPVVTAAPAFADLPCQWGDTAANPWNYPIDGVACVVLDTSNGIRLVAVTDVQPGWTYQVKSAGGGTASDPGRVEIRFSNASTKSTVNFRFEPGKTRIG